MDQLSQLATARRVFRATGIPEINRSIEVDIHSENSIEFCENILKADPWTINILKRGLVIPFSSEPPVYFEKNNKSALNNMDKLKQIVGEWELKGKCKRPICSKVCESVNDGDSV